MKADISVPLERYASMDLDRDSLADAWPGQSFDVVFCGEVIEHVFSPDRLLRQLASVMHDDSLLVLSTWVTIPGRPRSRPRTSTRNCGHRRRTGSAIAVIASPGEE